jgi:UDP-N-acetylglucosamine--N-acetylmuramyl-(pentapeptide) pyrophosphoryl-undecaprenol N-acetylglucosamine transferase
MRVPSVLIPYPRAADNHQFYNAWAFVESGAARMLEQEKATPETLVEMIKGLVEKPDQTTPMKEALAKWHQPDAAEQIAGRILEVMARNGANVGPVETPHGEPAAGLSGSDSVKVQTAQIA